MIKLINETVTYLKEKGFESPEIGIILGTGLGQLINEIEIINEVSYNHIPNFPTRLYDSPIYRKLLQIQHHHWLVDPIFYSSQRPRNNTMIF